MRSVNFQKQKQFTIIIAIVSLVAVLATRSAIFVLLGAAGFFVASLIFRKPKKEPAGDIFNDISHSEEPLHADLASADNGASPATTLAAHPKVLVGSELLEKVKELGDVSKSEIVRACGYVSVKADGSDRINFTQFYEALLAAKGITLAETGESEDYNPHSVETDNQSEQHTGSRDWEDLSNDQLVERIETTSTIDIDTLESLLAVNYWRVREAVALHPCTTESLLSRLLEDNDVDVRSAVARRDLPKPWCSMGKDRLLGSLRTESAPDSVLEQLSRSEDSFTRAAVASNPGISLAVLEILKNDSSADVRNEVGKQLLILQLPEDWRLLGDDERIDRLNQGTVPAEVLELLAISSNWQVRQAVARHEETPDALLNQLAEDDDSDVRQAIEDRRLPLEWRQLDEDERVKRIASMAVETEILEILSTSPSSRVRQSVASTTRTPPVTLERLSRDNSYEVRETALNSLDQQELPEDWKQLSELQKVKRLLTQSSCTEVLAVLALSRSPRIREAVARNSNSSIKIILQMKEDSTTGSRIERLIRTTWGMPPQEAESKQ